MLRRPILIGVFAAAVLVVGVFFWQRRAAPPPPTHAPEPQAEPTWFVDVAESRGVNFAHFDPYTPKHLIPETMGTGIAWIDFDNDGWPDLFCLQSSMLPPASNADAPTCRFFRNNRDGTFRDVTAEVGLNIRGYAMGCAVGDYDNDGFDDLVVTFLGGVRLFHNQTAPGGGRRFVEVTETAGLVNPHWATSCAWGDIDGDGLLDLYVCNYVEIDHDNPVVCVDHERKIYFQCSPSAYPRTTHRLFRNKGNGRFEDISVSSGIASANPAPGLAVVMVDLDGDGLIDIYAANDLEAAYLFHNQGKGKFEEKAKFSGCAFDGVGRSIAGMGIAVGDLDGTGLPSLLVTNFQSSPTMLFLNRGKLRFDDSATAHSGVGPLSMPRLKWGIVLLDANLDGIPDFAVANGHVHRTAQQISKTSYAQEAQLFIGEGNGKYRDASAEAGSDFRKPRVGRGLATADFDNDGLPDLALSGVGEHISLLRNTIQTTNHWISLNIVGDGKKSNRNAIGATVKVEAGGRVQHHFIVGGGSYLSASDRRLLIGLGTASKVDRVTVRYPSGKTQVFTDLSSRQWWRLEEGIEAAASIVLPKP